MGFPQQSHLDSDYKQTNVRDDGGILGLGGKVVGLISTVPFSCSYSPSHLIQVILTRIVVVLANIAPVRWTKTRYKI